MSGSTTLTRVLAICLCLSALPAQNGDKPGEAQADLPKDLEVPPAPVLSPGQGLLSLRVQAGFKVELVAAEPLVEDPVCIHFDAAGRIWVAEMRGYMPDVDGKGELAPTGRIVVLEDQDNDGRMDKSTVFLDKLVLPRLVTVTNQGVLVLEPPKLYLCQDRNGDLVCDEKTVIRDKLGGRKSPEHAINGGLMGLDNWLQFAKFGERVRFLGGRWLWQKQLFRGQWGICQDDYGRHYHNTNSDYLRGDFVPAHYLVRNPRAGNLPGANERLDRDQSTWPIRITPGINRGYQKHMLKDFKLARFTAACSPVIYRDEVFPQEFWGSAFVCEPAGNFVRCAKIVEAGLGVRARNAYEKAEFLASTDERFRPVDLKIGPDGGLYVVDMYRGILQHRVFVTSFLRKQILARGLDKPLGRGRIYRVIPEDAPRRVVKPLPLLDDKALIAALGSPSGWRRDRAQQLLIARKSAGIDAALGSVSREHEDHRARIHALWALEGRGELGLALLYQAITDKHPQVRIQVLRLLEPFAALDDGLAQVIAARLRDPDPRVRCQAILSLGSMETPPLAEITGFLQRQGVSRPLRGAVVSAVGGQELALLRGLPKGLSAAALRSLITREYRAMLRDLVRCLLRQGHIEKLSALVSFVGDAEAAPVSYRLAVAQGLGAELDRRAKKTRKERVLELAAPPQELMIAARRERQQAGPKAQSGTWERLLGRLRWPGLAVQAAEVVHDAAARRLIQKGRAAYVMRCMACHQMHGKGMPGLAPTLVGSPYVLGNKDRLTAILLRGLTGPIKVGEQSFNGTMPPVPGMKDAEIAAIASYVRNAWGQKGEVVRPAEVAKVRAKHKDKLGQMLRAEDLEALGK